MFQFINEHGLGDVVRHVGDVDTLELAGFYNAATVLAYPSLYEGFGLPVLEAMSCGCPVVSASSSSLPEIYGDAALAFDPRDADALTQGLSDVLDHTDLQAELKRRGFANCSRYSWARTADIALRAYHTL